MFDGYYVSLSSEITTWFPVVDEEVENDNDHVCEERSDPVHHEHDTDTEEGSQQGHPGTVVLEHKKVSRGRTISVLRWVFEICNIQYTSLRGNLKDFVIEIILILIEIILKTSK